MIVAWTDNIMHRMLLVRTLGVFCKEANGGCPGAIRQDEFSRLRFSRELFREILETVLNKQTSVELTL